MQSKTNSMKSKVDVTVNITAHKEGYYLHKTVKSALQACAYAERLGKVRAIIQINLDNPDELTESIAVLAAAKHKTIKLYRNAFGDLSASRNFLISKTTSPYSLFWDGDDLFTENFIYVAFCTAEEYAKPCIVSAQHIIKFSDKIDPRIHVIESTVAKPEIKSALFETNLFISQNLVSTEIYKKCKYESNNANYGFEDWHWNTKSINAGYEFLVAVDTVFFYRQKPDDKSLLKQQTTSNTVIRKTSLFKPEKFHTLPHTHYERPVEKIEDDAPRYENPFKQKARSVLKELLGDSSILYRAAGWHYRKSQKILSPVIHRARTRVDSSLHQIAEENIEDHFATVREYSYEMTPSTKLNLINANAIEPLLYFDDAVLSGLHEYKYTFEHSLASAYYQFCKAHVKKKFTDIIFIPWINRGGADLAMLDLARTLAQNGRSVLLITTSGLDSQWYKEATSIRGVTLIQSHDEIFNSLDHLNIKLLFLRIIQNWSIKTVTVMNSAIGFELLNRYGKAIKDAGCKTIAHNYAFPQNNGQVIEAFPPFSASLEYVDTVITDSIVHKNKIREVYGYPESSTITVPLPMTESVTIKSNSLTRKILFANRFAREKQPQIAIETLSILEKENITMDMFGTRDEAFCNQVGIDSLLELAPNINYRNSFEGSKNLKFDEYDICFLPSLYEGIPRICLDAIKANIFIVCTDVGGLPEIIKHGVNGYILDPASTASDFAAAIQLYYDSEDMQDLEKRKKHNMKVISKHSTANYKDLIKNIYRSD